MPRQIAGEDDPIGSFVSPVPIPASDPTASPLVCVQINQAWIPYIIGSLKQLMLATTWLSDDPSEIDLAISKAVYLIEQFSGNCPPAPAPVGVKAYEDDTAMPFRVDCDCNVFVTCCDGTEIQLATKAMLNQPAQPGQGSNQPTSGGGQACYHATMNANSQWLIPTVLNGGDVVTITGETGAVSNSHDSEWRCPDGNQFFVGQCLNFPQTYSTDPVPAAPNGTLVINVGGTFYSLSSGTFTVPGGVSGAQGTIQVNDAAIAGLSGSFLFDVCVSNNQPGSWAVTLDFRTSPHGFSPSSGYSRWTAGVGWQSDPAVNNGANYIQHAIPATHIGTVSLVFLHDGGANASVDVTVDALILVDGGANASSPSYQTISTLTPHDVPSGNLACNLASQSSLGGNWIIQSLSMSGTGVNPFA